ncbi:MAG: ABC transporter permease [Raoultibacter sp.]
MRECPPKRFDVFSCFTIVVALLVTLFIGSAICAIVVGGAPSFGEAIRSEEVHFALGLSLKTATISSILCFALAIPTAFALTKTNMPCKRIAHILLELTLSLPYILLGLALLIMFSSPFGDVLKSMGIKFVFSPAGIVAAQLIVNLPFAIRLCRTAFAGVDSRLEFIAKSLGASSFTAFRTITLPLAKNALISTFILTWSRAIGEFGATLMLVGITRMKTETLPGSIYLNISTGNNDMAMATAIIMLVVSGVALLIANVLSAPKPTDRFSTEEVR